MTYVDFEIYYISMYISSRVKMVWALPSAGSDGRVVSNLFIIFNRMTTLHTSSESS